MEGLVEKLIGFLVIAGAVTIGTAFFSFLLIGPVALALLLFDIDLHIIIDILKVDLVFLVFGLLSWLYGLILYVFLEGD